MQDITDEILVKAAAGDIASFEIIYRAAAKFVYNVAYRMVHNAEDAEEITQEVFLNIYHKLKEFRFQSSFKTWLYRITVNRAINYSKKMASERRRREEHYKYLDTHNMLNIPGKAEDNYKEIIDLCLKVLNPDQRICVVLRSMEGLSYQEIAGTLKISINTVRSRLKRAREKLLSMKREVIEDEV